MLELRHYQQEGIEFLREKKRAGLFDKAGLGKTVQAARAAVKPVMVVCPTYLTQQWYDFLTGEYPADVVALAEGTQAQRQAELNEPADWWIVNTEMLRGYALPFVRTVIFDEAHYLRHRTALQSKMAAAYAKTAEYVYLLTATPIVKEADDLWHLLHIINPKIWRSYESFVWTYCKVSMSPWKQEIVGYNNVDKFRATLRDYAIWRDYADVRLELPDMLPPTILTVPFGDASYKVYKRARDSYWLQTKDEEEIPLTNAMQVVQALRRLTVCDEKIDALKNLINDVDGDRPIVIFCWFKETVRRVAEALGKGSVAITGDLTPTIRTQLAKSSEYKYRIATLASLSEGVDLSDSRVIIFFEEDYTPGRMYQAISRVRRWSTNTDEPVRSYYINMKGSVDEVVHYTQEKRNVSIVQLMKDSLRPSAEEELILSTDKLIDLL